MVQTYELLVFEVDGLTKEILFYLFLDFVFEELVSGKGPDHATAAGFRAISLVPSLLLVRNSYGHQHGARSSRSPGALMDPLPRILQRLGHQYIRRLNINSNLPQMLINKIEVPIILIAMR